MNSDFNHKDILDYCNPYGTWRVTTEGDCEGRTIKQLGVHTGYVDEIAFALGSQGGYKLQFQRIDPASLKLNMTPKQKEIHISFDIDSCTWDLNNAQRVNLMKEVFKNRDVRVEPSNYYAAFKLVSKKFNQDELDKERALEKLTPREKQLLGV